ncbi:hypothetical protein [uncultured Dokdonia sp.]|uniref:hypothetical protein n=1 Tax=uncultured Dokdonia sp. TaxID=575653 RepID=UPI00262BAF66|nr:hypothetical protein [uncultured Dokdonia sp.]
MKKIVFLILATVSILSCNQKTKFDFKFADQEQVINCPEANNALLNEALYSFENDLTTKYDSINQSKIKGYGAFMYRGMDGSAKYDEIMTANTRPIVEALIAENILIENKTPSHLNYEHPAVQCIINNIKDEDLKATINALIDTKTMNPKLFNSRLRNFGRNSGKDRYLALFVALDGYYQQILNITPQESPQN